MILPLFATGAMSATALIPWIVVGTTVFFSVLYLLRVVPLFGGTVRRRAMLEFPGPSRSWYIALASYLVWIGGLNMMILQFDRYGVRDEDTRTHSVVWRMFWHTVSGSLLAVLYAPIYHNMAEVSGDWASARWRTARVWEFFKGYHGFTPHFVVRSPGDLARRDEEMRTMMQRRLTPERIEEELRVIDEHALLEASMAKGRVVSHSILDYTASLPRDVLEGPVIWAAHAHGVSALTGIWGVAMHGRSPIVPRPLETRCAVADLIFYLPVVREIALLSGAISVSETAIYYNLVQGRDIFVMPGGMLEQALSRRGVREIVYHRLGFCALANFVGVPVVPIYCAGEEQTYAVWNALPRLRQYCYRRWGYAFPWIAFGPLPGRLTPIVGRPVLPTTAPHGTREDAWLLDMARRRGRDASHPRTPRGHDYSCGETPLVSGTRERTEQRLKRLQEISRLLRDRNESDSVISFLVNPHAPPGVEDVASYSVSASADDSFSVILDTETEHDDVRMTLIQDEVLNRRVYAALIDTLDIGYVIGEGDFNRSGREGQTIAALRRATRRVRPLDAIFGRPTTLTDPEFLGSDS